MCPIHGNISAAVVLILYPTPHWEALWVCLPYNMHVPPTVLLFLPCTHCPSFAQHQCRVHRILNNPTFNIKLPSKEHRPTLACLTFQKLLLQHQSLLRIMTDLTAHRVISPEHQQIHSFLFLILMPKPPLPPAMNTHLPLRGWRQLNPLMPFQQMVLNYTASHHQPRTLCSTSQSQPMHKVGSGRWLLESRTKAQPWSSRDAWMMPSAWDTCLHQNSTFRNPQFFCLQVWCQGFFQLFDMYLLASPPSFGVSRSTDEKILHQNSNHGPVQYYKYFQPCRMEVSQYVCFSLSLTILSYLWTWSSRVAENSHGQSKPPLK